MSSLPTPTRTLVETSVGVREAAKNLQRLSIHWECPQKAVIVLKPDKNLIEKAQLVVDHLLKHNMIIYVEDVVYSFFKKSSSNGELLIWNANNLRASIASLANDRTENLESSKTFSTNSVKMENIFDSHQHALNKFTSATVTPLRNTPLHDAGLTSFNPDEIDLVITLGGDGTVLHASWLFQTIVPPVLPFHLGTLGFLTVFDFSHYKSLLDRILHPRDIPIDSLGLLNSRTTGRRVSVTTIPALDKNYFPKSENGVRITLRMRLTCAIYRVKTILSSKPELEPCVDISPSLSNSRHVLPEILAPISENTDVPHPDDVFQILNDLVVDRGPSPYMSSLEVFGDGKHLTTVQADGLVVSTPTGSTAYSLSAGGSMVHPEVPAILLTPICPHTLSFRPMLLPDSMELKIVIPQDARNGAWASFDGRHRIELNEGDALVVTASPYPLPTICRYDQTRDWFDSLGRCLRWNERGARQKRFIWGQGVVENEDGSC